MSYQPTQSPTGTATITEPTPPQPEANLTLDPLSITAERPHTQTFTGKLTDAITNVGIVGKTIRFFVNDILTSVTAVTDANGDYSLDYTFEIAGEYSYYTKYLGD